MSQLAKYNQIWESKLSEPYVPPEKNNRINVALSILKEGNSLLDVGCGDGCFGELAKSKYKSVYGLDISFKAVQQSLKKGILAQTIDSDDAFPFHNSYFDTVTCLDVIGHVNDPRKTILEMVRVLKENGTLILTPPNMRYIKHLYTLFVQGRFPSLSTSPIDNSVMYDGGILHYYAFNNLKDILEQSNMKITKKLGVFGRNYLVEFLSPGLVIEAAKL